MIMKRQIYNGLVIPPKTMEPRRNSIDQQMRDGSSVSDDDCEEHVGADCRKCMFYSDNSNVYRDWKTGD